MLTTSSTYFWQVLWSGASTITRTTGSVPDSRTRILLLLNPPHSTTTSLYTDCSYNLYAGLSSYLLIFVFCSISFRCGGLSIERNQKPLTPESTLAVTHHNKQKQVEVKRSNRANPHEIRLFSGCPYCLVRIFRSIFFALVDKLRTKF